MGKKRGRSEKKTDWFGNTHIQHYDSKGNKTGRSERKTDWLGRKYTQHYDSKGDKTGRSEKKEDWLGNKYTQKYNAKGEKSGRSEKKEGWVGNKYVQHYDASGNKTDRSEKKEDWLGNSYVERYTDKPSGGRPQDAGTRRNSYRAGAAPYSTNSYDRSGTSPHAGVHDSSSSPPSLLMGLFVIGGIGLAAIVVFVLLGLLFIASGISGRQSYVSSDGSGYSPEISGPVIDELNGSSIGEAFGITYADALSGQGAVFSREKKSRIQYRNIPSEGTLEWRLKVTGGYSYTDYRLNRNQPNALIFTTAGGDVWYPGSTWFYVQSDGKLTLNMATTKYDGPTQLLIAPSTKFRFNEWHSVGISFGSEGQYIMLDGVLVASAPRNTQKLGRGGTHQSPVDIPTVGEMVSGYWAANQYDAGFEGVVDRFRISNKQRDWNLSVQKP